jgi:ATP-dependent Clp protease ATP-binding subunit ClpA
MEETRAAIAVSPRMTRILDRAAAIGNDHTGRPFIGTENVLRALADDEDGIAGQVLRELGVLERVKSRLDEIMRSEGYRTPSRG